MQEKKKTLITPEKRSLNVCSKGLRDFRRLLDQLAKQPAPGRYVKAGREVYIPKYAIKGPKSEQEPEINR